MSLVLSQHVSALLGHHQATPEIATHKEKMKETSKRKESNKNEK
jgi:hypothetical protein